RCDGAGERLAVAGTGAAGRRPAGQARYRQARQRRAQRGLDMVIALSALLSLVLTGAFIQLATRRGWGKSVRSDGPASHMGKSGTPTMGGAAVLIATLV